MYDISMLSKDQVLTLINAEAGLSLTWDQVIFGVPTPTGSPEPSPNTELVIQGIHNGGYKNTATVFYNRIDLAELATLDDAMILQIEGLPTLTKVLGSLNDLIGSNLQPDDVRDDHVVPTEIDGGVLFTLHASDASYAYRDSVDVTIQPADIDINVAVADKLLNGLALNAPAEPGV